MCQLAAPACASLPPQHVPACHPSVCQLAAPACASLPPQRVPACRPGMCQLAAPACASLPPQRVPACRPGKRVPACRPSMCQLATPACASLPVAWAGALQPSPRHRVNAAQPTSAFEKPTRIRTPWSTGTAAGKQSGWVVACNPPAVPGQEGPQRPLHACGELCRAVASNHRTEAWARSRSPGPASVATAVSSCTWSPGPRRPPR